MAESLDEYLERQPERVATHIPLVLVDHHS
jgi:hypothetical protein